MTEFVSKVFSYNYLTNKDLKGFDKYKYSAVDTSPLSKYVMHPTWNAITKFIPNSVAPNLLTFAGFVCMLLAVVILSALDYDLTSAGKPKGYVGEGSHMPDWVLTVCGVLVFLAYHLDGVDGKQARKIGVSGPLGELFDHGLDSYVVFLIPFCIFSAFGRDQMSLPELRGFFIIVSVTQNFYVSHCEKYNTGTLYLPWSYDVSMWVASLMLIIAGVYTPAVYKYYIVGDVKFTQFFEVIIHGTGLMTTLPFAILNVYIYRQDSKRKHLPLVEAIRPIWSMLVMTTITVLWAVKSPNNIIQYDPRAFMLLYGTIFSNIACRLIVCEMSGTRCEAVCWLTWPLLAGVAVSFYHPHLEPSVLYALVVSSVIAHVHYGVCVVRQICEYFKISCFEIPKAKRK